MDAFEQEGIRRFENQAADLLEEFFPLHCATLGRSAVLEVVRYGAERAGRHGLDSLRGVTMYLGVMFLLGSHFDEDPQVPWAAAILGDQASPSPLTAIRRVHARALDLLDQTGGAGDQDLHRALLTIREYPFLSAKIEPGEQLEDEILGRLRRFYPEKCRVMGDDAARRLIRLCCGKASSHGITDGRGALMFVVLGLMLGSGFDVDPQFPWVAATLQGAAPTGDGERLERLHERAMGYLDGLLEALNLRRKD
jgi:hypothetical protein